MLLNTSMNTSVSGNDHSDKKETIKSAVSLYGDFRFLAYNCMKPQQRLDVKNAVELSEL